ncbi:hypothetical protein THOM_1403 [Trachipleistophora hominis]|uniref:Uncharacterized protein n=1 Tax=Trachipleistophora hominis TaxID=72359 RepID=L7JY07_TRAHO|nr:hypothetical protein THOM_1403 [Trachipleistophora hominis]
MSYLITSNIKQKEYLNQHNCYSMTEPPNELSTSINDEKCICKVLTRRFRLVDYTVKSITGNNIVVKMWAGKSQSGGGCGMKSCMNRKRDGMMEITDDIDNEEKREQSQHSGAEDMVKKEIEISTENKENIAEKGEVLKVNLDKHVC